MWIKQCTGWYIVDILVGHPDLPSRLGHPFPKLLGTLVVKISQLSAFMGDILSQSKGHTSCLGTIAAGTNDCPCGGIKAYPTPLPQGGKTLKNHLDFLQIWPLLLLHYSSKTLPTKYYFFHLSIGIDPKHTPYKFPEYNLRVSFPKPNLRQHLIMWFTERGTT